MGELLEMWRRDKKRYPNYIHTIEQDAQTYLPLAKLAKISEEEKTIEFGVTLIDAVGTFEIWSQADAVRSESDKDAIRKVETACNALLRNLENLVKKNGAVRLEDAFLEAQGLDNPEGRFKEDENPLDDFIRLLEFLKKAAEAVSIKSVPNKSESRTKILMQEVISAVDKLGGELEYNKNKHTGNLAEIYEWLRARAPAGTWTDLSPASLDRLRKRPS